MFVHANETNRQRDREVEIDAQKGGRGGEAESITRLLVSFPDSFRNLFFWWMTV